MTKILLPCFVLVCSIATAQLTLNSPSGATVRTARFISDLDRFNTPLTEKIDGTPYFNEKYELTNLRFREGTYKGVPMRYNIFQDQLEYTFHDSVFAVAADTSMLRVDLGKTTLIPGKYVLEGTPMQGYFVRLDSGKMTMVAKMLVGFREPEEVKPMQVEANHGKYIRMNDVHYFKIGNGRLVKIESMKKLIESLPDHQEYMKSFAKRMEISVKERAGMIRFAKEFNKLSSR